MSASKDAWRWLDADVVRAVHAEQLAEHGGGAGVRDETMLTSALARPKNLVGYGTPDAADLAAAYGFGIARNHPFIDGNKRTAFVAVELFLEINGYSLIADDADCVMTMLALAAGDIEDTTFGDWIRSHLQPHAD